MGYSIGDIVVIISSKETGEVMEKETFQDIVGDKDVYRIMLVDGLSIWIGEQFIAPYKQFTNPYISYNNIYKHKIDCDCGAKYTQDMEHQHFKWCISLQK